MAAQVPRWSTGVAMAACAALVIAGACADPQVTPQPPGCPNVFPEEGAACTPGLVCQYAEPSNCVAYFTATCSDAGTWSLERPCAAGGSGGTPSTGAGGEGGGQCVDTVEGPPAVTSASELVRPPDGGSGSYTLSFSEPVVDVGNHLSWSGAGALDGVSLVGSSYLVRFSGIAPGETATLTIDGVADACGTPMEEPVHIDIRVRPSCHVLSESFEGDFLARDWSAFDDAGDGHTWSSNEAFDPPVPNHTAGSGACASANDVDSGVASLWDTSLVSPPIDLSGLGDVVLRYAGDFNDASGAGDAVVEVSSDGFSWFPLAGWSDSRGGIENLDLSAWAGGVVYLRWRYINEGGVGAWWDIDDVCIESFTKVSCNCTVNGFSETKDVAGSFNGNGSYTTAENSLALLSAVGQRVTVCGELEAGALSGADFFGFNVATGAPAGPLSARVDYCIENPFEDASVGVWIKTNPTPLGLYEQARNQGSYDVQLLDGPQHFVVLDAPGAYTPSRYRVTVELEGLSMPILTEGFEMWPPVAFTPTDLDPCLAWGQASGTVVPFGGQPTEGFNLAYFNSYDCNAGSEALESASMSFVGLTNLTLQLDMYHDTGFPSAFDSIQVEYSEGTTWVPIGAPLVRPAVADGWQTESIDLTPLAGKSSVKIRLFATTAYGNDIHIDNVKLLAF